MKTVLYDQSIGMMIGWFEGGYKVDGMPYAVDPPVYELQVIEIDQPDHNPATQSIHKEWVIDIENGLYKTVWIISNKTPYELAMESWHHPEFAKRIIAPIELVMQYPAVETWFRINDLPIVRIGSVLNCYCNLILPAHQQLVDALSGIVTIEERPTE